MDLFDVQKGVEAERYEDEALPDVTPTAPTNDLTPKPLPELEEGEDQTEPTSAKNIPEALPAAHVLAIGGGQCPVTEELPQGQGQQQETTSTYCAGENYAGTKAPQNAGLQAQADLLPREEGTDRAPADPVTEQQIETLARELAENLHRDHLAPTSIFNFEEFEHEQQEMRLQHYWHQQAVQHEQQAYREEYHHRHGKPVDLTIQIAESPQYSALPSPGDAHYHAPRSPAWYYADETPIYENRSGTPCSRKDRLYEAMPYQYQEQEFTKEKYIPQFPYQPVLVSKAALRRVEDNKDDFFQRLYDIRLHHYANKVHAMREISVHTAQVVNTVHPKVLTTEQRLEVSNRLINHKAYTNYKAQHQRAQHVSALRQQQSERHVQPKSHRMVAQVHRKALGEIFDVLLVTAQLERERRKASSDKPAPTAQDPDAARSSPGKPEGTTADSAPADTRAEGAGATEGGREDGGRKDEELLDTALAQPHFLQPKQLADAMAVVLAALSPRHVPRQQFVEFTLHCMHKTGDAQQRVAEASPRMTPPPPAENAAQSATHGGDAGASDTAAAAVDLTNSEHIPTERGPETPDSKPVVRMSPGAATPRRSPATSEKSSAVTPKATPGRAGPKTPTGTPSGVVIPPIGYLLVAAKTGGSGTSTQIERAKGTQAQREYDAHFTGKPQLVAAKTTEKLARQRYQERSAGKQSVEDSLIAYAEVKLNNNLERRLQLKQQDSRDCTFQPNINSPYMVRYKSTARPVPAHKNVNAMLRSSSRGRGASESTPVEGVDGGDMGNSREDRPRTTERTTARSSSASRPSTALAAGWKGVESSPGLRATSARRGTPGYISTRPEIIAHDGAAATPLTEVLVLDQKEHLGFGQVRATQPRGAPSSQLHNPDEGPRQLTPNARQMHLNFAADRSREYRTSNLVAPSSAMYVQHNSFTAPVKKSLPGSKYGRFSYDKNAAFSNLRSPLQGSVSAGTTPRSSKSPARFFPPTPRTPTTATAAEYKLSQDALHRKMYQELYYNTP